MLIEIIRPIVERDGNTAWRQIVFIEPVNCLSERQDSIAAILEHLEPLLKPLRLKVQSRPPQVFILL